MRPHCAHLDLCCIDGFYELCNIKTMEASSKLTCPNYDQLQVASMLAADLEFIIILKKQKITRGNIVMVWISALLVFVHFAT